MGQSPIFHLVMLGWVPTVTLMFHYMRKRDAAAYALVFGFLFLPQGGYDWPLIPTFTKFSSTSLGIFIGMNCFDGGWVRRLRPRLIDLPMAVWCVWPFASSLQNGLGAYDGVSGVLKHLLLWGIPYLTGRVYFMDGPGIRAISKALLVGGLVYLPLCLWEVRMSSQLHKQFYGFQPRGKTSSASGLLGLPHARYRVFIDMAINCAVFMAFAAVATIWVRVTKVTRRIGWFSSGLLAGLVSFTAVLGKVSSAWAVMALGVGVLLPTKWLRSRIPLLVLVTLPLCYVGARTLGGWDGGILSETVSKVQDEKSFSFNARLYNESFIIKKGMQKPIFGWGPWGQRSRTEEVEGVDGLWIISFGKFGLVGVGALYLAILGPVVLFLWRCPRRLEQKGLIALGTMLGTVAGLYMIHNLFNAMTLPLVVAMAGGLAVFDPRREPPPAKLPASAEAGRPGETGRRQ